MNAPIPDSVTDDGVTPAEAFTVSLLDGPLRCEQSGVAVLELLAAMRNFHQLRDFSHQERFGAPDGQSRQALSQLGEVQQSLRQLVADAGGKEGAVVVEASLNVRMVPRKA
jgi:hypothetical protein